MENVMESGGAPMSPAIARKALLLLSNTPVSRIDEPSNALLPETVTERELEI